MLTTALIATLAVLYTKHRERIRARVSRFFGKDAGLKDSEGA
jgi:hypothetical protein